MAVDRLSITVPSELGAALRTLAEERGATISTLVTEAIAHQLRLEAVDRALAEADRVFGPVPEALIRRAERELARASGRRGQRPTRKARR